MALIKGDPWNNIRSLLWLWLSSATSFRRCEYRSHNRIFRIFWIFKMEYLLKRPPAWPWSRCSRIVDCNSSSTAANSGSSRLMSTRTVDWELVLGGGCHITGAEKSRKNSIIPLGTSSLSLSSLNKGLVASSAIYDHLQLGDSKIIRPNCKTRFYFVLLLSRSVLLAQCLKITRKCLNGGNAYLHSNFDFWFENSNIFTSENKTFCSKCCKMRLFDWCSNTVRLARQATQIAFASSEVQDSQNKR